LFREVERLDPKPLAWRRTIDGEVKPRHTQVAVV